MRHAFRILAMLVTLIGLACAHAQVPMTGAGLAKPGSGFTPSCSQSSSFLARATGLDTTHKTNYDTLICGLVTDGVFTKLDALYIYATDSRTNAVLNLVSSNFTGTENGTVSFSADHGYTGDGSTFFFDTTFNPNTATSPNYVLNSASMGVYVLTNTTSGGANGFDIGAQSVGEAWLTSFYFGAASWKFNDGQSDPASATSQGQWIASRTASTTAVLYKNGSTSAFDTNSTASDFIPRTSFYVFGSNSGGLSIPSASQMSAAFLGGGLSSTDQASIAARINTYMTSYGINVY